jgi:histone acetyltransferase 1
MADEESSDGSVDEKEILVDDPNISSAALCIELRLLGHTFRPEYTHQCFPGEFIRGYVPRQELLPAGKRHRSYENHETANQELSVVVHLSPSCQTCRVDVSVSKKRNLRSRRNLPSKRPRSNPEEEELSNNSSVEVEAESVDLGSDDTEDEEDEDKEESSDFSVDDGDDEVVGDVIDPEGTTRHRRMPPDELLAALQKGLPDIVSHAVDEHYLRKSPGVFLYSYTRNEDDFCFSLAKGDEVEAYHKSIQRIALLYIETADDVSVESEDDGYWKVLYLFRKHSPDKYSLAGYVTLFHFSSPFRKPKPGTVVRVCQVVVLPPYQRSGHGREMLHKVHDLVQGHHDSLLGRYGESIVEVNVEDPAPGFVVLRNLVDYERYLRSMTSSQHWLKESCFDVVSNAYFEPLPELTARDTSMLSKLTVQQMQVVYEIDRLRGLLETEGPPTEANEKKYRLLVKKRLNRENREELDAFRSKALMKEKLEELYQQQRRMYDKIMSRVRHHSP